MNERKRHPVKELIAEIDEINVKSLINNIIEVIDAIDRFFESEEESGKLEEDTLYNELKSQFETLLDDYGKRLDRLHIHLGIK